MKKAFAKIMASALVLLVFVSFAVPANAALTSSQINSILSLLDSFGVDSTTRANVEASLTGGTPVVTTPSTGGTCSTTFTTFQKSGVSTSETAALQTLLNSLGFSVGSADGSFGPMTAAGVKAFQSSKGLGADGIVGPNTRAALNASCSTTTPTNPTNPTTPATGSASAAVYVGTPAAMSISDGASADVAKFSLSAGANALTVTSIDFTRDGLTSNSDLTSIRVIDAMTMAPKGSVGSLNSNNKAKVTFTPALVIPAGTSWDFYVRASVASGTASGKTFRFGIAAASDINASETMGGVFPFFGPLHSTVDATVGTVTLAEDGSIVDSQPDVGDTDVSFLAFKVTAGSTEAVTLHNLWVERKGSAGADATSNIELYDVSKGQTIATLPSWGADGNAFFGNLNMVLSKGETRRFEVRADVVDGAGLTFNGDIIDGSSANMTVTGNTFGFYIAPTTSWTGTTGQADSSQTVQSGAFTVTKSSSTPATGNISAGDDQLLAVYDVTVQGEAAKISSIEVNFDLGTMLDTELTNIKLLDGNDVLLAGPSDGESGGDTSDTATFTDVIILNPGTNMIKVTGNIASSVSNGDTIQVDIDDPSTEISVTGLTSNDTITPAPASTVASNTLTVQGAALVATTLTQPAAQSVVPGVTDFIFATASLTAANSGEAINVSSVVVEDTVDENAGGDSGAQEIDNVEIWADLTSANSARGDVYETKVSDTKQFTGTGDGDATLTFSLNPIIKVEKNATVNIAVVADLGTGADADDTHTISLDTDAGDVTATGASTGTSVSVTPTGAGQTMTVAANGALTVTVDSSSPVASLLLDDTSAEQTVAVFRLAASNVEDIEIDDLKITSEGTDDLAAVYYFYDGATLLGTVAGGANTAQLFLADNQLVIPANDNKKITVKAKLNNIDGTQVQNGDTIIIGIPAAATDINATGKSSGADITPGVADLNSTTHVAYEAYPSFSFQSLASTTINQSANYLAARINVTANGDKDITFSSDGGADDDKLSIQVTVVGDNDDAGTEAVTLKDQDGNTLDTGTITSASGTTQIDFTTWTVSETIAAGTTQYLDVIVDTSDLEGSTDVLQIWLDDVAADLTFSIDSDAGNYAVGDKVFKSDIFGPSHTGSN